MNIDNNTNKLITFIFKNEIIINKDGIVQCDKCDKTASLKCKFAHTYSNYLCKYDKYICKRKDCKYFHENIKKEVNECIYGEKCRTILKGELCKYKHSDPNSKPKIVCKFGKNCRAIIDPTQKCNFYHEKILKQINVVHSKAPCKFGSECKSLLPESKYPCRFTHPQSSQ